MKSLLIIIILASFLDSLSAQAPIRERYFSIFPIVDLHEELYLKKDTRLIPLSLDKGSFSNSYSASRTGTLKFYRGVRDPETGELNMEAVASTSIPTGIDDFYIILGKSAPGSRFPLSTYVVVDGYDDVRPNTVLACNLSTVEIALNINGNMNTLLPGKDDLFEYSTKERSIYIQAAAHLASGWEMFFTDYFPKRKNNRIILFLYPNGNSVGYTYEVDMIPSSMMPENR